MSKKFLILNETELELVVRQVDRLLAHKERVTPRDLRRKENDYKALKGLRVRLMNQPNVEQSGLKRTDIRIIERLANQGLEILNNSILPGYQKRMSKSKSNEERSNYEEYLSKAKETVKVYEELNLKLEVLL